MFDKMQRKDSEKTLLMLKAWLRCALRSIVRVHLRMCLTFVTRNRKRGLKSAVKMKKDQTAEPLHIDMPPWACQDQHEVLADVELPKKKPLSLTQQDLRPTIKTHLLPADTVLSMHNSGLQRPAGGDSVSTDPGLLSV